MEIKFDGGYKALITKAKSGKYVFILTRRNKVWESNGQYSRMFTAKRGAERALARIRAAK